MPQPGKLCPVGAAELGGLLSRQLPNGFQMFLQRVHLPIAIRGTPDVSQEV